MIVYDTNGKMLFAPITYTKAEALDGDVRNAIQSLLSPEPGYDIMAEEDELECAFGWVLDHVSDGQVDWFLTHMQDIENKFLGGEWRNHDTLYEEYAEQAQAFLVSIGFLREDWQEREAQAARQDELDKMYNGFSL